MTSNRRSCRALLAATAAIGAVAIAPAAANAAVSVTVTGDDGNPIALGGTLNIRNMNPHARPQFDGVGPFERVRHGSQRGEGRHRPLMLHQRRHVSAKPVDYIGNGVYTVTVANFSSQHLHRRAGQHADPAVHDHGVHAPSPRLPPRS